MSYTMKKPYTQGQKNDFIVKYNHNLSLRIEENDEAIFALEKNELLVDGKPVVDPDFEEKQKIEKREMLNRLTLTKADFWIALLDRKITKDMVKEKINLISDEKLKAKTLIRIDEADKFWRGDASMDIIASMFGLTPYDLDYLFENKEMPDKPVVEGGANNG